MWPGGGQAHTRTLDVIQQYSGLGGNDSSSQAAGGNDVLQAMLPHLNKLESSVTKMRRSKLCIEHFLFS